MAEDKIRRLKQVATTLNIGTATIVDYLSAKGFDVENKPTTKITAEQFSMLAKEFASSMQDKIEAEELNIGKKPQSNQVVESEPHHEPKKTTEPEQEILIKSVHQPKAETPEAKPKTEEPKAPAQPAAAPVEAKLPGIKVLGKIDLDAKGRPIPKAAPKAEEPKAPAAEQPKAPEAKAPEQPAAPAPAPTPAPVEQPAAEQKPAAAEQAPATPKAEAPKPETPKTEEKPQQPATPPAPAAEQKTIETEKAPAQAAAPQAPDQPAATPVEKGTEPIETITAKADQLKGLTVLGKIELPDSTRRKGTKPVASSDDRKAGKKKKRKRIIVAGTEQGGGTQGQQQGTTANPQSRPI
ncbi:translation initiation factor IF-2, partial [Pontibacter sp. BAB1700]